MNKEFKTNVSPCTVTDEDLALINKLTVKELSKDEIYTFNVIYGGEYAELSDITISAWDVVEGSNTLETEED